MGQGEGKYEGVRFTRKQLSENKARFKRKEKKLIEACQFMAKRGLTPKVKGGYAGNASFKGKIKEGGSEKEIMVITASGANLGSLKNKDLIEVTDCNFSEFTCSYKGEQKPSSETILHHAIYRTLKGKLKIRTILHGHSDLIVNNTEKLNLPETENFQKYGSKELAREIEKLLEKESSKEIVAKDHGFFAMGETIKQAKKGVKKLYKRSKEL